jgi:hypothetical protein
VNLVAVEFMRCSLGWHLCFGTHGKLAVTLWPQAFAAIG